MPIVLENNKFRLTLTDGCHADSLVLKSNGEECIYREDTTPFFSITEERPYNNEIKLAHPNKRTTFAANRVRREGDTLIVGFELINFEAAVDVKIEPDYMIFTLREFVLKPDSFGLGVVPIVPPVYEFRVAQLSTVYRERFGEWLNVSWDDRVAVNVLAISPYSRISSDRRRSSRVMYGELMRDVKLLGEGVALIVSEPDELLDVLDTFERDLGLPLGAESRRSPLLNRSYYWSADITPENVDEHIAYAVRGGFRFMSVYYTSILEELGRFQSTGDWLSYRKEYPRGREDLVAMLEKIKAAGITPGLHVLHTHIGLRTRYLTPIADHRINLTKHFTLAKPIGVTDTEIYVEECPMGVPVYEKTRVLRFMGELIKYESFTTDRPYRFVGCERGFNDTVARAHEVGTIGGILDISEFCANSAYIDQRTSLQDEIAEQIADIYNAGFEFMYFDGSEGVIPPFDVYVGLAQWRVYSRLSKAPIFCEGAAKSHFSWHMLSGGNAFDKWTPEVFKEMIAAHPFAEAPHMANDLTRLNFGWWGHLPGQRADIFEYGTALGAAWDCPGSFASELETLRSDPRTDDILETFRRWEDARESGFVTDEVKRELRHTEREHTLLINESGEYELAVWEQIDGVAGGDVDLTAFLIERDTPCVAIWNNKGDSALAVKLPKKVSYVRELGGDEIVCERDGDLLILPVGEKRYLAADMDTDALIAALRDAKVV